MPDGPSARAAAAALAQGQPPPDKLKQRGIRLDRQLVGARPGHRQVTGQGQAAAAEVQHAQRLPGRRRQVDQVPEPAHVLELQVPGIVEVHVRLRCAVHQERPGPGPVRVGDQLDGARVGAIRLA